MRIKHDWVGHRISSDLRFQGRLMQQDAGTQSRKWLVLTGFYNVQKCLIVPRGGIDLS